jgi:putative nucleotidyltransferase with HDIG domain
MTGTTLAYGADVSYAVGSLIESTRRHDGYTADHSIRTSRVAHDIAATMGFPSETAERVHVAALLHDIGKIGVPRSVLHKSAGLDRAEQSLIRLHPILGASILSTITELREFAPHVMHHHERFDGNGYPNGLRGAEIPIESRIILVADAFDAMTTDRHYSYAATEDYALSELQLWAGRQFDPSAVEALLHIIPERAAL